MLPKISYPIYDITLPLSNKTIKIRPFLVKEEKLLLMALESNDNEEIIKTTLQVINNCILSEKFDLSKLPFFEVDYLFIVLRAKSVGESIDIKFTCNVNNCNTVFPVKIDISNVKLIEDSATTSTIDLMNSITVKMKYPNYEEMKKLTTDVATMENDINTICSCINVVVDKDKVYTRKDFTKKELLDFVEGLTKPQYAKLETFTRNFPSFVVTAKATCTKCKYEHDIEYDDFLSFFE